MKKEKNHSYLRTVLLFILAVSLLAVGGVGSARALPAIVSEYYSGGVELYDIGVTLLENGTAVSSRTYSPNSNYVWDETYGALLGSLVPDGQEFHIGQAYPEALSVTNSGSIDEFVRVSIYKYWVDAGGRKLTGLVPGEIDLHLLTDNGWVLDSAASSTERTVLYYTSVVPAGGSTAPFSDTLRVSAENIPYQASQSTNGNVITTTYSYDNVTFQLDVQVDGVQTHNAEAAIKSAWGRTATVSGNSLALG